MIEKMSWSNTVKINRGRQYNIKEGLGARYNFFGSNRKEDLIHDPNYTRHH